MEIIVNGTLAVLKAGSSFQYVSENRAFTDAEGYSLSISFPIKDCPRNIQIFGHLYRPDVRTVNSTFNCEIRDKSFVKYGSLTLIDVSPEEIKAQFLEGKSSINNNQDFDNTYVNELNLGRPSSSTPPSPAYLAWNNPNVGYVALPWVNNSDGSLHNALKFSGDSLVWDEGVEALSFFPYLLYLTKKICEAINYDYDFSEWDSDDSFKYLLVCNVLPASWETGFASCLPHWSVSEYFSKLGLFLQGEFTFDELSRTVSFKHFDRITPSELVCINKVVDSFELQLTNENDDVQIVDVRNINFKEQENPLWKFYRCPWFIEERAASALTYDTLSQLLEENKIFARVPMYDRGSNIHKLFYAKDVDMYMAVRCIRVEKEEENRYINVCIMQPLNIFADRVVDSNSDNNVELEIVPAWIDEVPEKGHAVFVNVTAGNVKESESLELPDRESIVQPFCLQSLEQNESENSEYFNALPVAFWDGAVTDGQFPCPAIDWITINDDWTYTIRPFSLRLTGYMNYFPKTKINTASKYIFSFLSKEIPNVRSIFLINNQRFVCEKITATFTENGLSELMKGEFYAIS